MATTDSIWAMRIADFCAAAKAHSTPGSGAAAAVSAGMGLALIVKGLRITDARQPTCERGRLIERAEALLEHMRHYADADVDAFDAYLAAARQTRDDGPGASRQAGSLDAAAEHVNRVPLDIARACLEALDIAVAALPLTSENLQSDAHVGARLLYAAIDAVLMNVDANLPSLPQGPTRDDIARSRRTLQTEADRKNKALVRPSDPGLEHS